MDDNDLLMSLADIAEMAGVTRPAASNWRRRNDDFPRPIEETGATSLFRFDDVRAWMAKHHKRWDSRSVEQLVWSAVNPERAVMRPEEAARAGIVLLGYTALASRIDETLTAAMRAAIAAEDRADLQALLEPLNDQARQLGIPEDSPEQGFLNVPPGSGPFLVRLLDLASKYSAGEVFDALVAAIGRGSRGEGDHTTPRGVTALITALADPIRGVVFDSACGYGGLLLAARQNSAAAVTLIGQDISADACQVTRLRMLAHDLPATISHRDSLVPASVPTPDPVEADLVLADPSLGTGEEMAWLHEGLDRLRPGGTAFFVFGSGAGSQGGNDSEARRRLLTSGSIRAIIALPPALYPTTTIPVSLWIVTRPGISNPDSEVLFIDASSLGKRRGKSRIELLQPDVAAITACFREWVSSGRAPAPGRVRAAAVPVARIIEAASDLSALRWMELPTADPEEIAGRVDRAAEDLELAQAAVNRGRVSAPMLALGFRGSDDHRRMRKVGDLADILPAKRMSLEWIRAGEVRYIRSTDVGSGLTVTQGEPVRGADNQDRIAMTQPYDIVVASDGVRLRAAVDREGGSAVSPPLQIIRPFPGVVDPFILAALIRGGASSVPLSVLEIPVPDSDLTERLGCTLRELDEQRRRAAAVIDAIDRLCHGLTEALGSPAIQLIAPSAGGQ